MRTVSIMAGLAACGLVAAGFTLPLRAQIAVTNQGYVPFSDAPIFYRTRPLSDPVALLQKKLDEGRTALNYDPRSGYLPSVLKALDIPVSSQTLVFSRTSFQFSKISPDHPRALYYNDDVYVGAVHQGKAVEIISFDPMQGAIFYVLDDQPTAKPVFQRAELDCTQCHIAAATRGVPGVLLRSVYPVQTGSLAPRSPQYITDQKSPLEQRWGGWYVTPGPAGADLSALTMANRATINANVLADQQSAAARPELGPIGKPFDPAAYLTGTSEGVAMLVLGHQTQMHNLITLTNYQTRLALHDAGQDGLAQASNLPLDALPTVTQDKIRKPAELLLRYLLFSRETSLGGLDGRKVLASSRFAKGFAARGPHDGKGRSLRDFDLSNRIFRYPCSYLIYSDAFDALPEPAKSYVYRRLHEVLTGQDQSEDFAHLSARDRADILAILIATKPDLAAQWRRPDRL